MAVVTRKRPREMGEDSPLGKDPEGVLIGTAFPSRVVKLIAEYVGKDRGEFTKAHCAALGAMWNLPVLGALPGFHRFTLYVTGSPNPHDQATWIWTILSDVAKKCSTIAELPLVAQSDPQYPSLNLDDYIRLNQIVFLNCDGIQSKFDFFNVLREQTIAPGDCRTS